jgi:hypothetical protein
MTEGTHKSPDPADVLAGERDAVTGEKDEDANANPSANPASDGTPTEVLAEEETEPEEPKTEIQEKPANSEVDTDFVFVHTADPMRNIPGTSQYHDLVERKNAEIIRAKAEGREPDLENAPGFQGSPLVTIAQANQSGLNVRAEDGDNEDSAVEVVTLPVVVEDSALDNEAGVTYDALNGPGGTLAVNEGVPIP